VRGDDDGGPRETGYQDFGQGNSIVAIKVGGRFIRQYDQRVRSGSARQRYALALAPG
jgi:hypothetical protein